MPTRAIKVWNQSASAWENVGIEAPAGGGSTVSYQAASPSSPTVGQIWVESDVDLTSFDLNQYLTQASASATYIPISASSTLGGSSASVTNGIITTSVFVAPEERFNVISGSATGTVNLDAITSTAWVYNNSGNTNFTINIRGNSTTSLNSILNTGDAITVGLLNRTGTTASAFFATTIQIDSASVVPTWINGSRPPTSLPLQSSAGYDSYTFTLVKTGSAAYITLGSWSQYR